MATLKEYFDKDFSYALSAHQPQKLSSSDGKIDIEVIARVHLDFNSNTKFISFFIPESDSTFDICISLIKNPRWALKVSNGVLVKSGFVGEDLSSSTELKFSDRIFIYVESALEDHEKDRLKNFSKESGITLIIRDQKYSSGRSALEKPLAFISHDSQNKDEIARPLAIQLSKMMCPVWFDEFSLKVGDNLRESIEKGLKECKKCVLILTKEFIANEGWTKKEFNSIFTREILEKANVILPVWYNVNANEIYDYSPSLVDKYAVNWDLGVEEVARRLNGAITAK